MTLDSRTNIGINPSLKASAYVVFSIAIPLVFVLAGEANFSVWLSVCMALASAVIVQYANRKRQKSKSITVFFWLAAAHAIYGYWAAGKSTDVITIGGDLGPVFRRALYIVTGTLLVAAFTYDAAARAPSAWVRRLGQHLRALDDSSLIAAARILVLVGTGCVAYLVITVGFVPMLAPDPGQARYIFTTLGPQYHLYDWVRVRGLEALVFSLPLVLFSGVIYRKKLDLLTGALGVLAVLCTMNRGTLISAFLVLMLTISFVRGKLPRRYLAYGALLAVAYFGSQLIYLNAITGGFDSNVGGTAMLSGLPELRDLGWVMSAAGDKRLNGATFLVPVIPGPGIATDFKAEYGLGYVTARVAGVEEGLRITLPGEGYLNFGVFGFLLIGAPLGVLFATLSNVSETLLKDRDVSSSFLVAVLFSWLCFWFYLGGTAAPVTNQYECMFVFAMFFFARRRCGPQVKSEVAGIAH